MGARRRLGPQACTTGMSQTVASSSWQLWRWSVVFEAIALASLRSLRTLRDDGRRRPPSAERLGGLLPAFDDVAD
jgi:hypothetical protein